MPRNTPTHNGQAEWLRTRLIAVLQRMVTVEEMRAALGLKQSTYYAQVQEDRLLTLENLRVLARNLKINEVYLMVECGLLDDQALRDYVEMFMEAPNHHPLVRKGMAAKARLNSIRPRSDAPAL